VRIGRSMSDEARRIAANIASCRSCSRVRQGRDATCDQDHSALGNLLLCLFLHRRDGRCVLAIGRCPVAHGSNSNQGGDNESSAISNSRSARSNNHRRKRLHASSSQASRSRAECGAHSSGPEGHKIYGDLEGHDCEIGKAKT
jgi:hypothetical protein